MSLFDEEFFPTPASVIEKMLEPYQYKGGADRYGRPYYTIGGKTILEPSAGKADILDFLKEAGAKSSKLYACELNPDLQHIVQQKGYRVLAGDFLQYQGDYFFDLIIGNPPFSNGDEHLLKAWEIMEEGDIVFLLNAETVLNPYSQRRKYLAKLIEDHGSYEVLGDVFRTAERRTGVNVALVRLQKKAAGKRLDFTFESKGSEQHFEFDEQTIHNAVARQDAVSNMLLQYAHLKEAFTEYLKAREKLAFYGQGLTDKRGGMLELAHGTSGQDNKERYNNFCDESKMEVWKMLIRKLGIERYMTNEVQKNFNRFIQGQGGYDLTKENIQQLIQMLLENSGSILEKAVVDVFDLFTAYHKDNRLHVEGWKTNAAWKVNRKVILPAFLSSAWSSHYSANHNRWSEYGDIDRVMCYLTGKRYEDLKEGRLDESIRKVKVGDSGLYESEFFSFRCYKKGTLHITFKDPFLWQEFNMRATKGKMWLPEAEEKAWQKAKQTNPNQLRLAS